jgi:hypothetical protein
MSRHFLEYSLEVAKRSEISVAPVPIIHFTLVDRVATGCPMVTSSYVVLGLLMSSHVPWLVIIMTGANRCDERSSTETLHSSVDFGIC